MSYKSAGVLGKHDPRLCRDTRLLVWTSESRRTEEQSWSRPGGGEHLEPGDLSVPPRNGRWESSGLPSTQLTSWGLGLALVYLLLVMITVVVIMITSICKTLITCQALYYLLMLSSFVPLTGL